MLVYIYSVFLSGGVRRTGATGSEATPDTVHRINSLIITRMRLKPVERGLTSAHLSDDEAECVILLLFVGESYLWPLPVLNPAAETPSELIVDRTPCIWAACGRHSHTVRPNL
jgi:hypothetical protein